MGKIRKFGKKQRQQEWETIKRRFSLKEGELVEIRFTPQDKGDFLDQLFLKVQDKLLIKYYVLLENEQLTLITKVENRRLDPVKLDCPKTLETQFTPITERDRI